MINQARAEHLRKHLGLSKLSKDNHGLLAEVVGGRVLVNYISMDNIIRMLTERLARVEAQGRQRDFDKLHQKIDDDDKAKIQDEEGEEIMDNIKSFIEKLALPISEWEFTEDNPENPYITMWFKGPGYDNDKAKIQDKESTVDDDDKAKIQDKDGTVINYWNMWNFMPFCGTVIGFEDFDKLHQKIFDEAATKIQTWWRNVKGKGKGKGMQIFVKTFDFGTITLDGLKGSDTIDLTLKKLRRKIDNMCTGYDVERMIGYECLATFKGKQLEDDRTLKYYNIQSESTLTMTWGLVGGGKRAKPMKHEVELFGDKVTRMLTLRNTIGGALTTFRNNKNETVLEVANSIMKACQLVDQNPQEVLSKLVGGLKDGLNLQDMRKLQEVMTTNRVDQRCEKIAKFLFIQNQSNIALLRQQLDMCGDIIMNTTRFILQASV